eukprot:scaffold27041_cov155-Skeletonema_menzelii.AAC.3
MNDPISYRTTICSLHSSYVVLLEKVTPPSKHFYCVSVLPSTTFLNMVPSGSGLRDSYVMLGTKPPVLDVLGIQTDWVVLLFLLVFLAVVATTLLSRCSDDTRPTDIAMDDTSSSSSLPFFAPSLPTTPCCPSSPSS